MKKRIDNILINDYTFRKLDSTSSFLKLHFEKYPSFTFVRAINQTNGHGRMNRTWVSSKNSLTFSFLIKKKEIIDYYSSLSLLMASAVYKTIRTYGLDTMIKWPNDIYLEGKKVCGILLESVSYKDEIIALVIGIGININEDKVKKEDNAISIRQILGKKISIKQFKNILYTEIVSGINKLLSGDKSYLFTIRENNYLLDKEVYALIDDEKKKVKVLGINDDNSLKVLVDEKVYDLNTGEISFHI